MNTKTKKISYRWTDRAVRLMQEIDRITQSFGEKAPEEIDRAAFDSVQHFVWATDCRRQANLPSRLRGDKYMPGWGARADKAHRAGKKAFLEAQKWLDAYRALKYPDLYPRKESP